jgi:hypothetical protein
MARVQVSDEVWAACRAQLGTTPVSLGLGRLVEREVARRRRATAEDRDGIREAVSEARIVAADLSALIARLERADTEVEASRPAEDPAAQLFDS